MKLSPVVHGLLLRGRLHPDWTWLSWMNVSTLYLCMRATAVQAGMYVFASLPSLAVPLVESSTHLLAVCSLRRGYLLGHCRLPLGVGECIPLSWSVLGKAQPRLSRHFGADIPWMAFIATVLASLDRPGPASKNTLVQSGVNG